MPSRAFSADARAVASKLGGYLLRSTKGSAAIGGSSVAAALRAAAVGAKGRTAEQMRSVLLSGPETDDRPASGDGWEVSSGLSLWADESLQLLPEYEAKMASAGAEAFQADFGSSEAPSKINRWTSDRTKGKIDSIIGGLSPNDRLVIVSAVYFKATWASQFDPSRTDEVRFSSTSGGRVVKMMRQACRAQHGETEMFVAAALPFQGGRFSMTVLVPRGERELAVVEMDPAAAILMARARMSPEAKVSVMLPRFKAESSIDLVGPLRGIGITDAFSDDADFSGMTGDRGLFISRIAHKALTEVDEAGAVAAAATAVKMAMRGLSRIPEIRADRTFLFAIRDEVAGEDLFVGRYDG